MIQNIKYKQIIHLHVLIIKYNYYEHFRTIKELEADIAMLKREKANKEKAFDSRKTNFSELIKTVKELQRTVEEERAKGVSGAL